MASEAKERLARHLGILNNLKFVSMKVGQPNSATVSVHHLYDHGRGSIARFVVVTDSADITNARLAHDRWCTVKGSSGLAKLNYANHVILGHDVDTPLPDEQPVPLSGLWPSKILYTAPGLLQRIVRRDHLTPSSGTATARWPARATRPAAPVPSAGGRTAPPRPGGRRRSPG